MAFMFLRMLVLSSTYADDVRPKENHWVRMLDHRRCREPKNQRDRVPQPRGAKPKNVHGPEPAEKNKTDIQKQGIRETRGRGTK